MSQDLKNPIKKTRKKNRRRHRRHTQHGSGCWVRSTHVRAHKPHVRRHFVFHCFPKLSLPQAIRVWGTLVWLRDQQRWNVLYIGLWLLIIEELPAPPRPHGTPCSTPLESFLISARTSSTTMKVLRRTRWGATGIPPGSGWIGKQGLRLNKSGNLP